MVARPGTEQSGGSGHARNIGGMVWYNVVGWVRQESAAATALVQAFIALGIAFAWWHWSPAQTGAVVGIVAALLGMFVRSQVTPIHRFRPRAAQSGGSGRGVGNGVQGERDGGVRVLPGTGAGPAGGPDPGMAGGRPPGPDAGIAGGRPPGPDAGIAGGRPPGPDAGMAGGGPPWPDIGQPTRPNAGPPGPQPARPDVGLPGGPDVPPDFPETGCRP
jgi:hypothetical protein